MTHFETWKTEKASEATNDPWYSWIAKAERIFGKSLDGDQAYDGYSLDYAMDAFKSGQTPEQYVSQLDQGDILSKYGPNDEIPGSAS